MPNDAKLGLVLGVAIVLVIGLLFFRSDSVAGRNARDTSRAASIQGHDLMPSPAPLSAQN